MEAISTRGLGWIWAGLGPVLLLMALISTVESETAYLVQLACFTVVSGIGLVAGVAAGLGYSWARPILAALSWLGFTFFAGSGVVMLAYSVRPLFSSEPEAVLVLIPVSLAVGAFGLPFLFMARKLRGLPEVPERRV